jgi:hypothetical protein
MEPGTPTAREEGKGNARRRKEAMAEDLKVLWDFDELLGNAILSAKPQYDPEPAKPLKRNSIKPSRWDYQRPGVRLKSSQRDSEIER